MEKTSVNPVSATSSDAAFNAKGSKTYDTWLKNLLQLIKTYYNFPAILSWQVDISMEI